MSARTTNKVRGQLSKPGVRSPSARKPTADETAEEVRILSILTRSEQRELRECEAVIARGWLTFLEVGRALQRIRDAQLYRYRYKAFAEYCRVKWKLGHTHAYRLIGAAQVMAILSPIGDIPTPTHESQVRPLLGLKSDVARAAWLQAVAAAQGRAITAKDVRQAVTTLIGSPPPRHFSPLAKPAPLFDQIFNLLGDLEQAVEQSRPAAELRDRIQQTRAILRQLSGTEEAGPDRVES